MAGRLRAAVAGTPLAERLEAALPALLQEPPAEAALAPIRGPAAVGLARTLAAMPEVGGFLAHRSQLLARIAGLHGETLVERSAELARWSAGDADDLEGALDALRLLRREESCLAACVDHSGLVTFEEVSGFLSRLAERIAQEALLLARRGRSGPEIAVIGMGKIAGREFTYHSDLDLIFLYRGETTGIDAASRVGQRLIAYLTTMTGAGIAYPVDTRLRPSGGQGMLVSTLAAFERYQREQAQTWEHLALLRARPIAGALREAEEALARAQRAVLAQPAPPWAELAEMRARVEAERAAEDGVAFKTGRGGLMDVDFLAGGAALERRPQPLPRLPGTAALLRAAQPGPRSEALLEDYAFLRRVEARTRWMTGRAQETLPTDPAAQEALAELVLPGARRADLQDALAAARRRLRGAWQAVVEANSIAALERAAR